MLMRENTGYMKYRLKIAKEYVIYLEKNYEITTAFVFDTLCLYGYVSSIQRKNKVLILTHLSAFLVLLDGLLVRDVRRTTLGKDFSLKKSPLFAEFLPIKGKCSESSLAKSFACFSTDQLLEVLSLHDLNNHGSVNVCNVYEMDSLNYCRLLFLVTTGVRFASSIDLYNNSFITQKKCKKFCYFNLRDSPANINSNSYQISVKFNQFLKSQYNLTAHKLRKYLPNLMEIYAPVNNTGAWIGNKTMNRFYMNPQYKYLILHNIINKYLYNNRFP